MKDSGSIYRIIHAIPNGNYLHLELRGTVELPVEEQPGASVLGSSHEGAQAKLNHIDGDDARDAAHGFARRCSLGGVRVPGSDFGLSLDAPPTVKLGVMPVLGNIRAFLASPLNMISNCYEK